MTKKQTGAGREGAIRDGSGRLKVKKETLRDLDPKTTKGVRGGARKRPISAACTVSTGAYTCDACQVLIK